jgi:SAM-dependent methyltransferase
MESREKGDHMMEKGGRAGLERQMRRQAGWLSESWLWLLRTKVLSGMPRRPKALDAGCGPGFVMEVLGNEMEVEGIDMDPDMVEMCRARGLNVTRADAAKLPFEDGHFDIAYCSFLLLWAKDPLKVIGELKRVSRRWVLCLAEPDYGGRIDHPAELAGIRDILAEGIRREGGDPFCGRKLRAMFRESGLDGEIGVHPGVWELGRLKEESSEEWRWIDGAARLAGIKDGELDGLREEWRAAIGRGILFQFNPVFYALARK